MCTFSRRPSVVRAFSRQALLGTAVIAAFATVDPATAFDFKLSDTAWGALDTHAYASYTWNGDDTGPFTRVLEYGTLNYRLWNGVTLGGSATYQYFTDRDTDLDNFGDGPQHGLYTAIGYATGSWGDILYGKTYGALSELIDVAPSAIGLNYTVNTPFFIHVERPRFAPRAPTASPDFLQPTERFGYYSADFDGFRLGVTYAESIQDDGEPAITNIHSKNGLDTALVWMGQLGDLRIRATGGYQQAEADVQPVNVATAADQTHWVIGSTLWWGNWSVGGNYAYTENTLGLRNVNNESWQIGAMYTWGKFQFSASTGKSTDLYPRDLAANPYLGSLGDATARLSELAASYKIHDNATLAIAAVNVKYEDELEVPGIIAPVDPISGTYGVAQLYLHF